MKYMKYILPIFTIFTVVYTIGKLSIKKTWKVCGDLATTSPNLLATAICAVVVVNIVWYATYYTIEKEG